MAFKKPELQFPSQIKVRLDENTLQALRDSAERHKQQHSVLGRMIIMDYLKDLRGSSAESLIAQTLIVAAELAPGIPANREHQVKVRLTLESFQEWKAIAAKLNVRHSILTRVAIKEFLDAERNGRELRSGMNLGDLQEVNDIAPPKLLTPEQQRLQEMEAQIARLERERAILKQAAAILIAE